LPFIKTLQRIADSLQIRVESLLHHEGECPDGTENILVKELADTVRDCPPEEVVLYLSIVRQIKKYIRKKSGTGN